MSVCTPGLLCTLLLPSKMDGGAALLNGDEICTKAAEGDLLCNPMQSVFQGRWGNSVLHQASHSHSHRHRHSHSHSHIVQEAYNSKQASYLQYVCNVPADGELP